MAATEPREKTSPLRSSSRPSFAMGLSLGLTAAVLIVSFQNCSVDLSMSTPGASTSGACGSPSAQALTDVQTVITGVLNTSCASCHAVNTGSVNSGFYTPETTSNPADTSIQAFAYLQLCVRGGEAVGLKIDGSNSHTGGIFPRGGSAAPLYNYLNLHF